MDFFEAVKGFSNFEDFYNAYQNELSGIPKHLVERLYNVAVAQNQANNNGDYQSLLGAVASNGATMSPEYEKWLDNAIANQRTIEDRQYQTEMRDTALTSAASQLSSLGLSTSNVINTGGASSGVSSSSAGVNMHSTAQLHQQERINQFNQKMGLAKSLIGAASSMASSGIYGAALGAVKNAGSKIAGAAAHSGLQALSSFSSAGFKKNNQTWEQMLGELGY